jgi:hypothetical protein
MPSQRFFYETSHANFGLLFDEDIHEDDASLMFADLKERAEKLDNSDKTIYKVVAQPTSNGDGVQIFVAPYYRYYEIAELLLDEFKHNTKAYITDKKLVKRIVKKKSFIEDLRKITRDHFENKAKAIELTVALLKRHYEKDHSRLDAEVEKIAKEYRMGVVKYQEYYKGLANTWLEYPKDANTVVN